MQNHYSKTLVLQHTGESVLLADIFIAFHFIFIHLFTV